MAIPVRLTCPHCSSVERMQVEGPYRVWEYDGNDNRVIILDRKSAHYASCATFCPACSLPFGVVLRPRDSVSVSAFFGITDPETVEAFLADGFCGTLPLSPQSFAADNTLPEKIRATFVFTQEDAAQRRNAPGILSNARSCLDVALKELGEATGGRRDRIQNLAKRGVITTVIADWAQSLWEEGSDAVHDLDADMSRAIEHVDFLRLFFEVVFTLPSKIKTASHGSAGEVDATA